MRPLIFSVLWAIAGLACLTAASGQPASYVLQPGDTIAVTVWRQAEYTVPSVQIQPDGRFVHPRAGQLTAAGKTPTQLAAEIRELLRRDLNDPQVTVTVVAYREEWVFVAGAVLKPGPVRIQSPLTVQQAIASAGGLTANADLGQAIIIYADGKREQIALDAELRNGVDSGKALLSANTTLIVQESQRSAAAFGAVAQPGIYQIPSTGMRVSDLLAQAGGLKPEADAAAVRLTRRGAETLTLNAREVVGDVNSPSNVAIGPGDALYVPDTLAQTFVVLGEVVKPGVMQLYRERQTHVSDALAMAGGLTPGAEASTAQIMHADGSLTEVRLAEVATSSAQWDLIVRAGDTIFVPEQAQFTVLGAVKQPGRYRLDGGARFSDAIAMAGGLSDRADQHGARLTHRDGVALELDTAAALSGRSPDANPLLSAGDAIVVDASTIRVAVLGDVARPGLHELQRGDRVSSAIAQAGGLLSEAARGLLSRPGEQPTDVDLRLALAKADAAQNVLLREGDTLYVVPSTVGQAVVLGAVKAPGRYAVRQDDRLSDLIAQAGGIPDNVAARDISLIRRDGTVETLSMPAPGEGIDALRALSIQEGDTVFVAQAEPIAVLGAVQRPGVYAMAANSKLSSVIAQAGGGTPQADFRRVLLVHRDGSQVTVDLKETIEAGVLAADVPVQGGDIVLVPGGNEFVSVLGSVGSPGRYPLARGSRIADLLALAGGVKPDAVVASAAILRGTTRISIPLSALDGSDTTGPAVVLQDGDILVLDAGRPARIAVLGEVKEQGNYTLVTGARLSSAVAQAGGLTPMAEPSQVQFIRAGNAVTVDLSPLAQGGTLQSDPELQDGDLVVIPVSQHQVTILGVVAKPGVYTFRPGDRVLDVLAQAGGWVPDQGAQGGAANRAALLRPQANNVVAWGLIDLRVAVDRGDMRYNVEVMNGDMIYVPPVSNRTLSRYLKDLYPMAALVNIFH